MKNKYITAKESDNLTLRCPFFGAYSSSEFPSWNYAVGLNYTSVLRTFQSTQIHLNTVSYKDMGKYFCTIKYEECSTSSTQRQDQGFVFVTITGRWIICIKQHLFLFISSYVCSGNRRRSIFNNTR